MLNAGKSKVKGKAKIQAQSNCNGRGKVQDKANGNVKVPAEDKGKAKVKAPLEVNETTSGLSVNDLAVRPRYSRDTGKQLDMTTGQLIKVMRKQVELLEAELLRRKQETDPYYLALVLAKIEILDFEEKNKELRTMLENREKLKGWLAAWVNSYIVRKGGPNYMELTLLQDDEGRRRGSVYMTNRSHIMSQMAYPYKPFGNSIEDNTEVKIHRGEDEHGVCIKAYENYVHFTVEGNYENVAKTWRFDYTESTTLYTVLMVEKMDEDILYSIQEHNELKLKRISVSGVFPGYPGQDRITITHAGIAVDERFPFGDGETRVNGFQWTIFEHITDRLTLVRWSLLVFPPVNAQGQLSLHETARSLRCPVNRFDSEEAIIERIRNIGELGLNKLRDQFRERCKRFVLEAPTMGSRDQLFEEDE